MISVIIPTYKEPEYLDLCLRSAFEGQVNENEIIVVVDGFLELNKSVLDKYPKVNILDLGTNKGLSVATNWGVYNATNDYILVVNDDNVFPKDWDIKLKPHLKKGKVITPNEMEPQPSMFAQKHIKDLGKSPSEFDLHHFWEYEQSLPVLPPEKSGSTLPFAMYKADYLAVGGWDIMYPSPHVVDWDFFLKCEYFGMEMVRIYKHFYHFCGAATRPTPEQSEESTRKEILAHKFFATKWDGKAEHNPQNNSKLLSKFKSKFRYIILSPEYDKNSGGITILHKLCHMLNELGENAQIFPFHPNQTKTNPKWNTPLISNNFNPEEDIVIYPEIIKGNPLNAKKIVRYILNNPRPKEKQWGDNEFWLYHNKFFYNYTFDFKTNQSKLINEGSPENYLHLIESRIDFFTNENLPRKGNCFTLRKGEEKGYKVDKKLKGAIEIKHNTSFEELKEIFNKTERFYCYDTCTYISTIAALCGCISIVIPEKGLDKEIWRNKNPALYYGVAYGEKDIPYALETLNKVKPYLENLENEMVPQLKEFIQKTKKIWQTEFIK